MKQAAALAILAFLPAIGQGDQELPNPTIEPTADSARRNAYHIFNSVHSVARLWGTAVHHNGFNLIPAIVPAGTTLYHGARQRLPPDTVEWLAFETEHAEIFARKGPTPPPSSLWKGQAIVTGHTDQKLLGKSTGFQGSEASGPAAKVGFLHTYLAKRDLNVLVLDGMSATNPLSSGPGAGSGDIYSLLLVGNKLPAHPDEGWDDFDLFGQAIRACEAVMALGYDAVFRAEAGFELIYCDFYNDGLELVSAVQEIPKCERAKATNLALYPWIRSVAQKYNGIGRDRLRLDFSSMVSGLFFPFNYSSPLEEWPGRIRLAAAGDINLHTVREYALNMLGSRGRFTINWQALTEGIVDRFSSGLIAISSPETSVDSLMEEIEYIATMYLSADSPWSVKPSDANRTAEAIKRCTRLQLLPAVARQKDWSLADELLYTAVETVMHSICHTYFEIYTDLMRFVPQGEDACLTGDFGAGPELDRVLSASQKTIEDLMNKLDWSDWRKTLLCPPDQVYFIAMHPWGVDTDHWKPGCRSREYFNSFPEGYW